MIDSGPATCTVHLGRDTGRPVPPDDSPWWHRQALCRGIDTDVFFPFDEAYLPERVRHERVAKAICAACPVRRPCAVHALVHREPHGVWGGLSAADRRDRLAQP